MPGKATDELAVSLAGLRRDYGERTALDGVALRAGRRASRWSCSGPTGPARRRCCASSRRCCARAAARCGCSGCALPGEAWKLRGRIGYLGHEPLLYRDLSGRENLRFHARLHGIERGAAEARIAELLAAVGMERRADERVAELSAGMRQRLAICRCVLHEPELLLLDEPDSNLDAEGRELARALIGPGTGSTRVVVTHDPERALPDADRALVWPGGQVLRECAARPRPRRARLRAPERA